MVFAKISTFDYGIVFKFDNNLMEKYNSESYSQPKKDGWLNLESNYITTLFVEKEVLEAYTKKNTTFIDLMRNKKVKIGMNEEQCRMAWGIPTSSMNNIAGYEKVLVYGSIGNSNNLYFKNNILKLIK